MKHIDRTNQVVAQLHDLVILVTMVAQNFLGQLAHMARDAEPSILHEPAHLLDCGFDGVAVAAVVHRVLAQHRSPDPTINLG